MKATFLSVVMLISQLYLIHAQDYKSQVWSPDQGDGTYKNPIIHADYSDPDICRKGNDFYMTSSSFNSIPGLPILHSTDLVNWKLINHALPANVDKHFDIPQHGNAVWAPSFRYHDGMFYIYWGDPDRGIFMVKTDDPAGEWTAPVLVKKAYGNIDACPLWDDDGRVYLVHAFAHSRAGVKSILQVVELNKDGDQILDKGTIVFDGHKDHPTIEGPKFYKRNGYYYIFAPGGGVPTGWQTILRSKNIYGPYEDKIVLAQGKTDINGPHQGGWVELDNGESWFVHFQDKEAYGRIVHLQPVNWIDDWPIMGIDEDGDGTGDPVLIYKKPGLKSSGVFNPAESDEFDGEKLSLQWQWSANPNPSWYSLKSNPGNIRLNAMNIPEGSRNLWLSPNVLAQKLPAMEFTTTAKVDISNLKEGETAAFSIFGLDYASIQIKRKGEEIIVQQVECLKADQNAEPKVLAEATIGAEQVWLQIKVTADGKAAFGYSEKGKKFTSLGSSFTMKEGKWVGAKIALSVTRTSTKGAPGSINVDWVRVEK